MRKTLSIIVPVYNSKDFLKESLGCLKRQNSDCLEFIIVNDGSTDNSESIVQNLIRDDNRFLYIAKPMNTGYGHTCNLGIAHSSGDYIAVFEPDDLIPDDFYQVLLHHANITNADIIKYNGIYKFNTNVDNKERIFKLKNFPKGKFFKYDYPRFWISHPATINAIYKKEFLYNNCIKYVEGAGASYQDVQFLVSLFYGNPSIVLLDQCKYMYRHHNGQSVNQTSSNILDNVIKNWKEFFVISREFINRESSWFAIIQMYRQCISLEKRMVRNSNQLSIFYVKSLFRYGFPKIEQLRWFGFSKIDIVKFYLFPIRVLFLYLISKTPFFS
ncbi:glycosyltransferase family 2 protein [Moraxella nonliquefaciens]|uniref:Glycosyltransferase family 2 protein n=2 Tax=Moraxella nonliquefaciens TaxID=478 RepID=A0A7T3BZ75_MORNO|nr:glycosyltransferase family 2 protein [Moraxella nonliquefaciens]QPT44648.1 glycosyltransferase family 2 protein [Moraxella nonliquefaciens]QQC29668.1 glycosyltransferase family 2 protein [Moraxella nonliquefaciens]